MKPIRNVEAAIRNELHVTAGPALHDRVLARVRHAKEQSETTPALREPVIRRTIMRSPIMRLAVAAVVVAVIGLGIVEFVTTGTKSGVVWAEVAQKIQASRSLVVRCTETTSVAPNENGFSMKYFSPTHSRTDSYQGGQLTKTFYDDFETMTATAVFHPGKHYMSRKLNTSEGFLERHEDWMNPRYLVQRILSCEHQELGQKSIAGVLCEGLETTDPAVLGPLPGPVNRLEVQLRLWVNAETEYPVLFEGKMSGEAEGKALSTEWVMDQFQWDVPLDPSVFEPNIPPDYQDMRKL
jgi:hypothetical protein